MTENLNCKTCGQNVMVSGLKNVDNDWRCRTCIKNEGATLQTVNAIGQYDVLEEKLNQRNKHMEEVLNTPVYNKFLNKLIKAK
jgi:hypothetical protein